LTTDPANLSPSPAPEVMQGCVEGSNVNVVLSMTDLVAVQRLFETMQQLIQTHRATDRTAVSVVGRSSG
jgi:flagellar basal body rod protein FlgG